MLRLIRRAVLSVSDKTGLVPLAQALVGHSVELISTGGTHRTLVEAGLPVREVAEVTGFPEMLDGRVKTLHPKIHGGILARREISGHLAALRANGIEPIDLVVVNLYPFEKTAAQPNAAWEDVVEQIDIGGPSLARGAAKNYTDVAVLTDPSQYDEFIAEFNAQQGATTLALRQRLAAAAFTRTANYDAAIARAFVNQGEPRDFPSSLWLNFERRSPLRYGENPHQRAAWYIEPGVPAGCVSSAEVLHGKELSYNNILDLDSALSLVREFSQPAAVVIKHNNPCGAAVASALAEAFERAYEGDPISAFGGIIGVNRELDAATATRLTEPNRFVECIVAPEFSAEALEILTTRPTWKKSVRLLRTGPLAKVSKYDYRRIDGGMLAQTRDDSIDDPASWTTVSQRPPTDAQRADLQFAWTVCKYVKSNAIVLARNGQLIGVGAGQMSRIDSTRIAIEKAGERSKGAVLASDAFFPFRDNVDVAVAAGIAAFVQPGGSRNDNDSITAANEAQVAMLFTGVRHFRH